MKKRFLIYPYYMYFTNDKREKESKILSCCIISILHERDGNLSALKAFCIFFYCQSCAACSLVMGYCSPLWPWITILQLHIAAVVVFVKTLDIIIAQLTELPQNLPTLPSATSFHATGWHTCLYSCSLYFVVLISLSLTRIIGCLQLEDTTVSIS